jgi:predicted transcriptional regulator of viral defense system
MQSIQQQIFRTIRETKQGTIFFPEQFSDLGGDDAVRQALSRICKEGTIIRLSKGIYLYPIVDQEVGILYPSVETVAKAIAERDRARIQPIGAYAMNRLGLSTQVPMNVVFLTDGTPRKVQIGRNTITFKKSAPKNFSFHGKITPLVIAALKEIGIGKVTSAELQKLKQALSAESKETVTADARIAPQWITNIMLTLV